MSSEAMNSPSGVTYGEQRFKSHQLPPQEGEFSTK
jgi:hypothetical protein